MRTQQPDDNNLMLAVMLSMAVLLLWTYFFAQPQVEKQQLQAEREKAVAAAQPNSFDTAAGKSPPIAAAAPAAATTREEAVGRTPRIAIETQSLKGSISLKGGLIDDLVLVKYRETVDPKSANVVLLSPPDSPEPYFVRYGWTTVNPDMPVPDGETVWKAETTGALTPATPVKLSWDNGRGLLFQRTIAIDDVYMLSISDEVQNKTAGDVALKAYGRLFRFGKPKTAAFAVLHEGLIGVPGDKGLKEIPYATAAEPEGQEAYEGVTGGWLGITDKYWAAALIPDQKQSYKASFRGEPASAAGPDRYLAEYELPAVVAAAGQSVKSDSMLFAGAKKVKAIEEYETKRGITQFELLIDWGWFYFFTKPLHFVLEKFYALLGNFGLAILAVTIIVKLAFFPLANKSYESMAKMKKLQPQMEALRERFKDDKARQQQELMQLYQKEKINPLAGCLPILIQIPVFFALYKVLFVSIDMRHAPFFGWIKDLSAADPTSLFNLFGLLPFAVPEFLHIGVWPIIMGITMWVQMQLNPPQPDPVQQQVFAWMPLIFTFMLGSFPAGLVIYWAWNNVLSIAQQWYISQKQGVEVHLMDNMRRTFSPILRLLGRSEPNKP